jgi:hypothetical protein
MHQGIACVDKRRLNAVNGHTSTNYLKISQSISHVLVVKKIY